MDVNNLEKMNSLTFSQVSEFIINNNKKPLCTEKTLLEEIEKYALEHHVPIMDKQNLNLFSLILNLYKPKKILELGTGIGYSALYMCNQFNEIDLIRTFEINQERYETAKAYINRSKFKNKIKLELNDFKPLVDNNLLPDNSYDLIYVDAAKGQYQKILDLLDEKLINGGLFIFDNIFINGWVIDLSYPNHRRKQFVVKMRKFLENIKNDCRYQSTFIPLSDGMLILRKL